MSTTPIPSLTLNDGHTIPQLGFGGDQIPPDRTPEKARAPKAHRQPPTVQARRQSSAESEDRRM